MYYLYSLHTSTLVGMYVHLKGNPYISYHFRFSSYFHFWADRKIIESDSSNFELDLIAKTVY